MPVHGPNLWPDVPGFRDTVLAYIEAVTGLGHALMRGIALSLELPVDYFGEPLHGRPADTVSPLQLPEPAGARGLRRGLGCR